MSDDKKPNHDPNTLPPGGAGGPGMRGHDDRPEDALGFDDPEAEDYGVDELDDEAVSDTLNVAEADAARLESEVADLKDQLARMNAEVQNIHRRHEKELQDMAKYAVRKFAKDIVEVADNFNRAKESVKPEDVEGNATVKGLIEGFDMTERAFLSALGKHGIQQIDAAGQPFNPHKHQAMMEQEDPSKPAGTILQVFQAGYEIAEQVLRPSMVVVSRGGPKMPKPDPEPSEPKRPTLKMPGQDNANPNAQSEAPGAADTPGPTSEPSNDNDQGGPGTAA
ncbi:MAG: nucleotide exchange factor GrpE [Hyphomicrobiaceae bacterium]